MSVKSGCEVSSDPPFLPVEQTGIGQQVVVMTLDCDSSPQRHSRACCSGLLITTHRASVLWYRRL